MLSRLLVILFIMPLIMSGQGNDCGTKKYSPADMQKHYASVKAMRAMLPHDTCLNRDLSVVFHIVLDSTGQPGVSVAALDASIAMLNQVWKPICIKFSRCSLNYVPDYNYNQWNDNIHEGPFFGNYFVDNTIDVVLVDNILSPAGASGYAATMSHIVIRKASITGITAIHEMGHLFGLPHTFDGSGELVRRVNCYTNGDGFCDTEADPFPAGNTPGAHCNFQPGPTDAANDYYTPPLDNYMTYFSPCRCRFTQEQYNFMALTFILSGTQLH